MNEAFYRELVESFSDWQQDELLIGDPPLRDFFRGLLEREARLLDQLRFDEWLALYTPECLYWVPTTPEGGDPRREVAISFDDRRRMEDRIFRLRTGYAWSQAPRSRTVRMISNVEVFATGRETVRMVRSCLSASAGAQEWPTRPVRIIVPYGPGGIGDLLVRLTTERLTKTFGQPFILENRPGGGGVLGVEYAAHSPADGYTLLQAGGAQFSVIPLTQKLNYDPVKDLTPISIIAANGMALAVNVELPIHSVGEFLEYAKKNPGKLNYGTGGVGTSSHLVPAAFAARAGLDMVAIPYQSTPASVLAVLNGTVQVFFGNLPDILETYRSGRVRLLALSNAARISQFPDVPTVAETVPGFVMTGWNGYFAPAGTPEKIVRRLSQAVAEICREPEVIKIMTGLGLEAAGSTPEEVAETIRRELPIYEAAVTAAGLRRN